jgi:hypothetical protein
MPEISSWLIKKAEAANKGGAGAAISVKISSITHVIVFIYLLLTMAYRAYNIKTASVLTNSYLQGAHSILSLKTMISMVSSPTLITATNFLEETIPLIPSNRVLLTL